MIMQLRYSVLCVFMCACMFTCTCIQTLYVRVHRKRDLQGPILKIGICDLNFSTVCELLLKIFLLDMHPLKSYETVH